MPTAMTCSDDDRARGRNNYRQAKLAWPPVRQPHPDDHDYLTGILRSHGLRQVPRLEPVTLARLRRLLRRAGVYQTIVRRNVGLTLEGLVERNPGVALWWLTATTLEACQPGA